jgi:uncharacterized ferritin-like protein (DUF455 family)
MTDAPRTIGRPPLDTVEGWAWNLISTTSLQAKLDPPPVPTRWEDDPPARRVAEPGRPGELRSIAKAPKTRGLTTRAGRARVLHTFFHHELQAAELMAWAILAFPEAPTELRAGLLRVVHDEIRHMRLYEGQIERLGHHIGDFAVRDWFWERVPACVGPASFLATMSLGFEGANLEHSSSFAARFRTLGDEEGARVQELVGMEEIAHVRFGALWFSKLTGGLTFDAWRASLPPPLSPMLMRGRPLQREARSRAGFPPEFIDRLDAWRPE